MIAAELSKWMQTLRISLTKHLAYKVNFLLLVIGPTIVFFFVKYNLWSAIYDMEGVEVLQGYDFRSMLTYQVWVMIVAFLAQGYNSMNLSEDIRLGRISSYLIYPFSFWKFHTAGFFAFQVIQLFVAAFTLVSVLAMGLLPSVDMLALMSGVAISMLVGGLWFAISYVLGLMAFWLEETWVLRVMFMLVASFLSGATIPLEIYPAWLQSALNYTPFPYMTFVPVKIFMGEYSGSLAMAAAILVVWTVIVGGLGALVWRKGIRMYTAAGM